MYDHHNYMPTFGGGRDFTASRRSRVEFARWGHTFEGNITRHDLTGSGSSSVGVTRLEVWYMPAEEAGFVFDASGTSIVTEVGRCRLT